MQSAGKNTESGHLDEAERTPDAIVNIVIDSLYKGVKREAAKQLIKLHTVRVRQGIKKYGVTVENNRLPYSQWLQHLLEEIMDATVYAAKVAHIMNSHGIDEHPIVTRMAAMMREMGDHAMAIMEEITLLNVVAQDESKKSEQPPAPWPEQPAQSSRRSTHDVIRRKWTSPQALEGHPNLFPADKA